jgi:hypothetical protein
MDFGFFSSWIIIFGIIAGAVTSNVAPVSNTASGTVVPSQAVETTAAAPSPQAETLAKCLTAGQAKFYGAYWCPHCAEQKKILGTAMQFIDYVECDPKGDKANPAACQQAGVQGYPTWQMPQKKSLEGTQTLQQLADWSGCKL